MQKIIILLAIGMAMIGGAFLYNAFQEGVFEAPEPSYNVATGTSEMIVGPIQSMDTEPITPEPKIIEKVEEDMPAPLPPPSLPNMPSADIPSTPQPEPGPVIIEPADTDAIQQAIPRIICGNSAGSSAVVRSATTSTLLITATHVVINKIADGEMECDVHFPVLDFNSGFYVQTHKRRVEILYPEDTEKNFKENAVDIAVLKLIHEENEEVFTEGYPFIDYPLCPSDTLGDDITLYGYAGNIGISAASPGSVLSRFAGYITQYGDIIGVSKLPDGSFRDGSAYLPKLSFSVDMGVLHEINIIFSENNFSGASGGVVFNSSKNCIVGLNSATGRKDSDIFGLIVNPAAPNIASWLADRGVILK